MKCTISCNRCSLILLFLISFTVMGIFYVNRSYSQTRVVGMRSDVISIPDKPEVVNRVEPEVVHQVPIKLSNRDVFKPEVSVPSVFMLDSKLKTSTVLTRSVLNWSSDDGCCEGDTKFVKTKLISPSGSLPIYVHPASEDQWVSGAIIQGNVWEGGTVKKFYNIFQNERNLQFIDIGANIGVYGLTLANMGVRVLMVEPFLKNVQKLCKSVRDGGYKDTYVLHNALSSTRHPVGFGTYHGNIGGTYVRNLTSESDESSYAILLDDLLDVFSFGTVAIKLDVETHEAQVLQGASAFFSKVDVRYLMVEWHKDKAETGPSIVTFLTHHNMVPHHPSSDAVLDTNDLTNWPGDIFWKKKYQ